MSFQTLEVIQPKRHQDEFYNFGSDQPAINLSWARNVIEICNRVGIEVDRLQLE